MKPFSFHELVGEFRSILETFPDRRTGKNRRYSIVDAGLGAFSVFFTQSPSFLSHQAYMQEMNGKNNANSLFNIEIIPTINHTRKLLDTVHPNLVNPLFHSIFNQLEDEGYLDEFRDFQDNLLVLFDGTQYFSSQKISCEHCSTKDHKNGTTTYSHTALTPVIAAPHKHYIIPLAPEYITPQDGHAKQDCEIAAAKRWIEQHAASYASKRTTILGDDLYSRQPLCERLLLKNFNFIFVCKPESHQTLYRHLEDLQSEQSIHQLTLYRRNGKVKEKYMYRYANHVPLRDSDDALYLNWCEVTQVNAKGEIVYHNSFLTNHDITRETVSKIVTSGRTRWKIENENNNILKTKGYHLEHNFGHGKKYLSSLLASFNILAFLFHTILGIVDNKYQEIRQALPTRQTFFDDVRALTRYMFFSSWDHLLDFMIEGLKLELDIACEISPFDTS